MHSARWRLIRRAPCLSAQLMNRNRMFAIALMPSCASTLLRNTSPWHFVDAQNAVPLKRLPLQLLKRVEKRTSIRRSIDAPSAYTLGLGKGYGEVAFIGASNCGKSSLLNAVVDNSRMAETSSQPGKTRKIDWFVVSRRFALLDLPGYGYARASQRERGMWLRRSVNLLTERPREVLRCVCLLVPAVRQGLGEHDAELLRMLLVHKVPVQIVVTKCDKSHFSLNESDYGSDGDLFAQQLDLDIQEVLRDVKREDRIYLRPNVILTSSKTKDGINDLRNFIATAAAPRNDSSYDFCLREQHALLRELRGVDPTPARPVRPADNQLRDREGPQRDTKIEVLMDPSIFDQPTEVDPDDLLTEPGVASGGRKGLPRLPKHAPEGYITPGRRRAERWRKRRELQML
ncbi:MAG: hypothetical protein MHM6MM_001295 [Cercozoa sp. M6MM]